MITHEPTSTGDLLRQMEGLPGEPAACLNCGAALRGTYCARCGQPARTQRLTFPRVVRESVAHVLSLDWRVLRTARALLTRPGPFIREYLQGQRAPYSGPLPYYFLVVAANVAAAAVLGQAAVTPVEHDVGDSFADRNFVALQIGVVFGLLMLPLAVFRRVLHRSEGYSVAEHFAFLLYALAQSVLAVILLQLLLAFPLRMEMNGDLEGVVWLSAFTVAVLWGSRGFLAEATWRVALKLLASFAALLVVLTLVERALNLLFFAG